MRVTDMCLITPLTTVDKFICQLYFHKILGALKSINLNLYSYLKISNSIPKIANICKLT